MQFVDCFDGSVGTYGTGSKRLNFLFPIILLALDLHGKSFTNVIVLRVRSPLVAMSISSVSSPT